MCRVLADVIEPADTMRDILATLARWLAGLGCAGVCVCAMRVCARVCVRVRVCTCVRVSVKARIAGLIGLWDASISRRIDL
jgi:hypothetical protein